MPQKSLLDQPDTAEQLEADIRTLEHEIAEATALRGRGWVVYIGDVLASLRRLPDKSVHCVITSPPYWGLRDYGTAEWEGGDAECNHVQEEVRSQRNLAAAAEKWDGRERSTENRKCNDAIKLPFRKICGKCGARRVDQQIGLESSPAEFIAKLVEVFEEVRRVLRDDGTCWINMGDTYAGSGRSGEPGESVTESQRRDQAVVPRRDYLIEGIQPKSLMGMPWLLARALQSPKYTGRIKNEMDRAWLAAIIDGEGTICASRHKRKDDGRVRTSAFVFVTNSCQKMLSRCGEIWNAPQYSHLKPSDGHLGKRQCYRWMVQGAKEKSDLLCELYPYLVSKKRQALLAWNLLQFIKQGRLLGKSAIAADVREKRDLLCKLISELNQGGEVEIPAWCKEPPPLYSPGWILRQDVIWHKKSPMPEAVQDRCTKAHEYIFKFSKGDEYFQAGLIQDHEYVFLLAKQQRYFYDGEAIREPGCRASWSVQKFKGGDLTTHHKSSTRAEALDPTAGRNCRSVWTLATEPLKQKHFAAFPSSLPARCIKAGTSERGCCALCGAPWVRIVETERVPTRPGTASKLLREGMAVDRETGELVDCPNKPWAASGIEVGNRDPLRHVSVKTTTGWQASCECNADVVPATVLDPFSGSGTSGLAANELGRSYIGCELSEEYALMSATRIESWKTRGAERPDEPLQGQKNLFD